MVKRGKFIPRLLDMKCIGCSAIYSHVTRQKKFIRCRSITNLTCHIYKKIFLHNEDAKTTIGRPICDQCEKIYKKEEKNYINCLSEDLMEKEEVILSQTIEFTIKGTHNTIESKRNLLNSIHKKVETEISDDTIENIRLFMDSHFTEHGFGSGYISETLDTLWKHNTNFFSDILEIFPL